MKHAQVLGRFPAGSPRGSWPAEELAARLRSQGRAAEVVMDLATDAFLVVAPGSAEVVHVDTVDAAPDQRQYTAAS
ncbi:hypothetical protein [Streptomyces sp. NPDC029674]|uniref:hypothetical protein n=1 Tax=Streptomyces sp. NPDC029674 TaxID=3365297 RepID=UPI00384D059C